MTLYADLGDLEERDRIRTIAQSVAAGLTTGFVVDDEAKADRYLAQLQALKPCKVLWRGRGPIAGTVMVKVGPLPN